MDGQALCTSLRGDQALTQQMSGCGTHFSGAFDDLDAAGFAAATSVHLRFNDPHRAAQTTRHLDGLLRGRSRLTGGHRDAISGENLLGLVFVQVHRVTLSWLEVQQVNSTCKFGQTLWRKHAAAATVGGHDVMRVALRFRGR